MKKFVLLAFTLLFVLIAVSCAKSQPELVGGYSKDRKPTAEEIKLFEKVTGDVSAHPGVTYGSPTAVSTQVVAGTNYRFTAKVTALSSSVEAEDETYDAYIYIYQPLPHTGDEPELVSVERIK